MRSRLLINWINTRVGDAVRLLVKVRGSADDAEGVKDASGPSDSLSKVARLEEVVDEEEYGQQSGIGQEGRSTRETFNKRGGRWMRRRDGGSGVSERPPREDVLWRWFQC